MQNIDGEITEYVLTKLVDMRIVALGVHDSFIFEESHKDVLLEVMNEVFDELNLLSIPGIKVST